MHAVDGFLMGNVSVSRRPVGFNFFVRTKGRVSGPTRIPGGDEGEKAHYTSFFFDMKKDDSG